MRFDLNRIRSSDSGHLDASTRTANLQHMRPEWTTWDFVDVIVSNLPREIKTVDLWNNFKNEGELSYIEIFSDTRGEKKSRGKLRFRPPPKRDFFTYPSKYVVTLRDTYPYEVLVRLDQSQKKTFTKPSPSSEGVFYPETIELGAESIDFGVLVAPEKMLIKRTRHSSQYGKVRMILNLGRKEIDIRFPSVYSGKTREYKFLVPIDQVCNIHQYHVPDETKTSFTLTLHKPPHFYKKLSEGIPSTHDEDSFIWNEHDAWFRQSSVLSSEKEVSQLKSRSITLKNHPEGIVNIGQWTTYRITVDDRNIDKAKYRVFRDALRDHNVSIIRIQNWQVVQEWAPAWELLDSSTFPYESGSPTAASNSAFATDLQSLNDSKKNDMYLPFSVRYQLDVCISNGLINEHNVTRAFLVALAQKEPDQAQYILEIVAQDGVRFFDPMHIFRLPLRRLPSMKRRIPDNCFMIRSAVVTPSTMRLSTPYLEMSNRVVRRYNVYADHFLRVRFEDDESRGYARIHATSQKTMDEVFGKVFRTLTAGIDIGDRHYDFLASGNSQLREHGAYFFAAVPAGPNASQIRAWMGRFENEHIVAKHAARIGQCFSTTRAIQNTGFTPVRKDALEDDVVRNGFNFTDGVGKLSRFYAETIAKELGLRVSTPSVYQFRMAGCKGVLAIAHNLGAINVKLRQSQYKFETVYSGMEIIRCSEYWSAHLNRQLILVLSALGVPDGIFLEMQEKEISLMERAMVDDGAATAALLGHIDPNKMSLTLAEMVQAKFRRSNKPFVTSLLRLWRAWSIKYLKEKAKLHVQKGAFLLGCTDETGTLRGHFYADQVDESLNPETNPSRLPEVFVQVTCPDTGRRKVIEGLSIMARNPSLHPGDIRVVMAVDVPALHHLVDVLVLPQTGDRDLASMCSGGDLDGDDYIVIWDKRLLPTIWGERPMDYRPPPPIKLDRDVTQTDITKFFVQYIKNDFLPRIAHAHLAWGDYLLAGVRSSKCLVLAELHSKAVDYPKSGQPAQMPKSLNVKQWPHFMEKKGRPSYRSSTVLGQLYDAVDRVAFAPNYEAPFDERILHACEPAEEVMQGAREMKRQYDTSLQRIMAQHEIKTEFEVWSTFVLDHSKASNDYKFHDEIGKLSSSLKAQYHDMVVAKAGGKEWRHLVPWAVAMYRVTKEELDAAVAEPDGNPMPFISFPWLLRSTLGQIAKRADQAAGQRQECAVAELAIGLERLTFDPDTQVYDDPHVPEEDIAGEPAVDDAGRGELATTKHDGLAPELTAVDSDPSDTSRCSQPSSGSSEVVQDLLTSNSDVSGLAIPVQILNPVRASAERSPTSPSGTSLQPETSTCTMWANEKLFSSEGEIGVGEPSVHTKQQGSNQPPSPMEFTCSSPSTLMDPLVGNEDRDVDRLIQLGNFF